MMIISFYSSSSTEVEYQGGYITSIHQTQSPEKTKDNPCEEARRRVRKELMREMRLTTMCTHTHSKLKKFFKKSPSDLVYDCHKNFCCFRVCN